MPGFKRNSRTRRRIPIKVTSKTVKATIVIALALILISLIILGVKDNIKNQEVAKMKQEDDKIYELFKEEDYSSIAAADYIKPDTVINIISLGDILCETELYEDAYNEETDTYNFIRMFERVKGYAVAGDYTIASLETNFVENTPYSGKGKYNAPNDLGIAIRELGVDLLNTANNHSIDYGYEGVKSTIDYIEELGLENVGTYRTEEESQEILIKDIRGIKIAFLSYTYGTNVDKKQVQENSYCINIVDKEKMKSDIQKSKEQGAEFTFVLMHWGDVDSSKQNNEQKELADYLFDNGADFILGTHPASIQPMEVRENSSGKNIFIAYSTGNFISASEYKNSNLEMVLNIELTRPAEGGETRLSKVTYTPIYLLDKGKGAQERFMLVDIAKEMAKYESGIESTITQKEYERLAKALEDIHVLVGKE